MKRKLGLVMVAAGAVFFLLTAGCATSRKKSNCNCPGFGKEIYKDTGLEKSS